MTDEQAKEYLQFQTRKETSYLFKRFLGIIENARNQHVFMLEKMRAELPEQYHSLIRASNWMDDNEYAYYRKQILDAGNETARAINDQISKFTVSTHKE